MFHFAQRPRPSVQTLSPSREDVRGDMQAGMRLDLESTIIERLAAPICVSFAFDVGWFAVLLLIFISCEVTVPVLLHIPGPYSTAIEHW
jgi:hypothetical protein